MQQKTGDMVEKTGYLLIDGKNERYIQIESELLFYHGRYISAGKHNIIEGNSNIGTITINEGVWSYDGMETLCEIEKSQLFEFIKNHKYILGREIVTSFGFGLELNDNMTYCEVLFKNGPYNICFDGKAVAQIDQDENFQWVQLQGEPLSDVVMETITRRLEDYYQ